jgi:hypothetical protein
LIQGTALVGVDGGVDVAEVISAVMTMLGVGVVMVVAVVGDGLITLAAVEVDGAQVAVVAPPGVLVLAEVEGVVTATVIRLVAMEAAGGQLLLVTQVVEVEVAGELLLVVPTLVVEVVAGEQLLEAQMTTQDGAPLKRWSQHRRVETAGAPVAVGDGFTLNIKVDNY